MINRLEFAARWCATAFSFFVFGLGAVVVWVLLFPLISLFLGKGLGRKRRAHRLMHWLLRFFVWMMRVLGVLTYEVHGRERLNRPGRLIVANHPSLLDVVMLLALVEDACCIVKPALANNPFLRGPIAAIGYLYALDPASLLERCAAELRDGSALIAFPEGTRTTPGQPRRFHRGVASVALPAAAPIVPVYIDLYPTTLTKQDKWYRIPPRRMHFKLIAGPEIDPTVYSAHKTRALAARALTRDLYQYYLEQDALHGTAHREARRFHEPDGVNRPLKADGTSGI